MPSDTRCIGDRNIRVPDQHGHDARGFRRQLQASGGRQIERSDGFDENHAKCRAAHSLQSRPQSIGECAELNDEQIARIDTEPDEPRPIRIANFVFRIVLTHQDDLTCLALAPLHGADLGRKCQRKAECGFRLPAHADNLLQP